MIIYHATKSQFLLHVSRDDIEEVISRQYRAATGHGVGTSEVQSWKNSLFEMSKVLADEEIPADVGVAIEYQLPQSSKRVDFVITGEDSENRIKVVIVELKQWSESRRSDKDAIVWARRGGKTGEREGPHPSYQAWSYSVYLEDFNAAVQDGRMALQPCAYLHNHPRDGEIDHPHYREHMERAPLFLAKERDRLIAFIRDHVKHGDRRNALYAIESGRIRPSKMLSEAVVGLLQGKPEFTLIDDQKVVFEAILAADRRSNAKKQVLIIRGGPGTGKSVVAINALSALIAKKRNARYVSKNAAPRAVYEAKLTGTFKKTRISNLFSGSGAFVDVPGDTYDVLVIDEAHRLNEKSGLYRNLGENQVKELMAAARCAVFFVDDDQIVTLQDIGHSAELRKWAEALGAEVEELELSSQFRCNGSDGYLAWLDGVLQIRETANPVLQPDEYDFRVLDDPSKLHELIELKNRSNNRSRVVAGYCWKWPSKKNPAAFDIELPEYAYRRQWNLEKDGSLWIVAPESVEQVGCIHTCQGLELDYVGVIIGPDMTFRDGRIATDPGKRALSDQSIKGLKAMMRTRPEEARELADRIIKNTYRALMTRGMKGCYVYCTDPALRDFLRSRLAKGDSGAVDDGLPELPPANVLPLRRLSPAERANGVPALPVVSLKVAAGSFSDAQALEESAEDWVSPPEWMNLWPGMFVAQVIGESMNKRVPKGAWCVFGANPGGTREGKIVLVQHRSISDPDIGGRFTLKRYHSEKVATADGGWRHRRIELRPESNHPAYNPITIEVSDDDESFAVVAELLVVL